MNRILTYLASFGLATILLILLLIYTLLGTLEQVEHGLHDSQLKYFESALLWSIDLGACLRALNFPCKDLQLPVLLPGGYTVLALFCLNIIAGGIIRIRKSPRTIGVVIAHLSMAFMIIAGGVSMHSKIEGNLTLLEGQTDDQFLSLDHHVIEIEQVTPPPPAGAKRTALVIDERFFKDLSPNANEGKARTFTHPSLPFDLSLENYARHSEIKPTDDTTSRQTVDGYYIQPLPVDTENERNFPAIYASVKDHSASATETKGILWLRAAAPWTVKSGDKTFVISLNQRSWTLPYGVRLEKATREFHPGTQRPRKFESIVTKLVSGKEERKEIKMNEPLRSGGYTLFQHQMMSAEDLKRTQNASVFQVVSNPADQWPLYSCIAVAIGLLIHFAMMLARYLGWHQWLTAALAVGLVAAYFAIAYINLY